MEVWEQIENQSIECDSCLGTIKLKSIIEMDKEKRTIICTSCQCENNIPFFKNKKSEKNMEDYIINLSKHFENSRSTELLKNYKPKNLSEERCQRISNMKFGFSMIECYKKLIEMNISNIKTTIFNLRCEIQRYIESRDKQQELI